MIPHEAEFWEKVSSQTPNGTRVFDLNLPEQASIEFYRPLIYYSMAENPKSNPPAGQVPLSHEWTFWHEKFKGPGQSATEYADSQLEVCSFDTVQKFWHAFNALPSVTKLGFATSYHLMRKGIRPVWEDPENEDGGFWSLKMSIPDAETVWKEMCICLIGEQISPVLAPHGDELHGVTVSIRKEYAIIQVWNKKAHPETEEEHISKYLKANVIPQIKTTAFFYKPCRQHTSYAEDLKHKLSSLKASQ